MAVAPDQVIKCPISEPLYTLGVNDLVIRLAEYGFAVELARILRETRELLGWSQRELARRAHTSQSEVSRLERGLAARIDLAVVEAVLTALGIRASLRLDARHLEDRRRQVDALHARINGYCAQRLKASGWPHILLEEGIGGDPPRGWIDQLAYRPDDRSLLCEEIKTDIPDMGGLQRSLAFYEGHAMEAARRHGWRPRRLVVVATVLDTAVVRARLADTPELVARAFPGIVDRLAAWIVDPGRPAPAGWTMAAVDPAVRGARWLWAAGPAARHRPAYAGYAEAAGVLLRGPGPR